MLVSSNVVDSDRDRVGSVSVGRIRIGIASRACGSGSFTVPCRISVFSVCPAQMVIPEDCVQALVCLLSSVQLSVLFQQTAPYFQCCGTVTIFYGSGSGSDF
jgi:hypothetical protein